MMKTTHAKEIAEAKAKLERSLKLANKMLEVATGNTETQTKLRKEFELERVLIESQLKTIATLEVAVDDDMVLLTEAILASNYSVEDVDGCEFLFTCDSSSYKIAVDTSVAKDALHEYFFRIDSTQILADDDGLISSTISSAVADVILSEMRAQHDLNTEDEATFEADPDAHRA